MNIIYPYLPEGRAFLYVPISNPFMARAEVVCRSQSTDKFHPNASVLVRDGAIIGEGANQAPLKSEGLKRFHKNVLCVRRLLHIRTGRHYWLCPGCASPRNHGESVAIRNTLKQGVKTEGADLYLWGHWWCCQPCWQRMIRAGIRDVYLLEGSEVLFNRDNPANVIGK